MNSVQQCSKRRRQCHGRLLNVTWDNMEVQIFNSLLLIPLMEQLHCRHLLGNGLTRGFFPFFHEVAILYVTVLL